MEEEKNETTFNNARKPDYTGKLSLACWVNKDKNGNDYLSVKIGNMTLNLFSNEEIKQE